jgi:hypothetical protein
MRRSRGAGHVLDGHPIRRQGFYATVGRCWNFLRLAASVRENCVKKNLGENDGWCRARAKFKEECDKRGGATIGMTKEEVAKTCWGLKKPEHINQTRYATHVEEQWVYESSNYLYFRDGFLTAIQTSRAP